MGVRLEQLFDSEFGPLLVLGLLLDLTELEGASYCTDGFAFKSICYGLKVLAVLFIGEPSPYYINSISEVGASRLLLTAAVCCNMLKLLF